MLPLLISQNFLGIGVDAFSRGSRRGSVSNWVRSMSRSRSNGTKTMSTSTGSKSKPVEGMEIPPHLSHCPSFPPPTSLHLWSPIVATDSETQQHRNQIDVVYRRRKPRHNLNDANS